MSCVIGRYSHNQSSLVLLEGTLKERRRYERGHTDLKKERLLNILLPKVGVIRLHGVEELRTDRRYSPEELSCMKQSNNRNFDISTVQDKTRPVTRGMRN